MWKSPSPLGPTLIFWSHSTESQPPCPTKSPIVLAAYPDSSAGPCTSGGSNHHEPPHFTVRLNSSG